jgi:hypothetical protein
MSKKKKSIEDFFTDYELHFNQAMSEEQPDVASQIQPCFAACFIESSPLGVACGRNDNEFVKRLEQGFDFYKSIGSKAMNIVSKDITILDDFHALAKIYWRYTYVKEDKPGNIDFHVIYFLTLVNNEVRIFGYITGDEQKALREKGLIQEEALIQNN